MAIVGVGLDIVDVARIRKMAEEYGDRFLRRVFNDDEIEYCMKFSDPFPHLAARWAAKEAVTKALGTGFSQGVTWKNVCVINAPSGEPIVLLTGTAQKLASSLKVKKIWLSLSHTWDYAAAVAVVEV